MRYVLILLILLMMSASMGGQQKSAEKPKPPSRVTANVSQGKASSSSPVIAIKGLCGSSSGSKNGASKSATSKSAATAARASTSNCNIEVSRGEFETLTDTLQVPPGARKQFATQYSKALIMAHEAHKRGLDQGPSYESLLKVARVQILTRQLAQALQKEAAQIPNQEVEDYYKNNSAAYEEATLERIYIPRTQQKEAPTPGSNELQVKSNPGDAEAAMKKEADDLRNRAAAGEDFAKLQAEAYQFANFKAAPPPVKMEKTRRTTLPPSQSAVFDLKPQEVSQVISDPGGYFIYRLEEKDTVPIEKVHDEIRNNLQKQKMQDLMRAAENSGTTTFDESYFAALQPAAAPSSSTPARNLPATPAPPAGPK